MYNCICPFHCARTRVPYLTHTDSHPFAQVRTDSHRLAPVRTDSHRFAPPLLQLLLLLLTPLLLLRANPRNTTLDTIPGALVLFKFSNEVGERPSGVRKSVSHLHGGATRLEGIGNCSVLGKEGKEGIGNQKSTGSSGSSTGSSGGGTGSTGASAGRTAWSRFHGCHRTRRFQLHACGHPVLLGLSLGIVSFRFFSPLSSNLFYPLMSHWLESSRAWTWFKRPEIWR